MFAYKLFLSKLCALEGVTPEELTKLTGRSRSVVYEWLNLADKESFPPFSSLEKILCRLGITLDQMFACHHPLYGDGSAARIYGKYTRGAWEWQDLGEMLLEDPNADAIISTYLNDRRRFSALLTEAEAGEIDMAEFDCLATALRPILDTEVGEEESALCYLDRSTLPAYRRGLEILKEWEGEEKPVHRVLFPDASRVILLASLQDLRYLEGYLHLASPTEKATVLESYLALREEKEGFDKKNKLLKRIIASDCRFDGEEAAEKYRRLLARVL